MEIMAQIESLLRRELNVEDLESRLKEGLNSLLANFESGLEIKLLNQKKYFPQFAGVKLFFFNANDRAPYFRTRLDLIEEGTLLPIAWYEQEYDFEMNVLDDYFDFC